MGETLRARSFAATHVGRRRTTNQDAFLADDGLGLYVVADGMGGHAAGEVASQEAVETIYGMVKKGLDTMPELRGAATDDRVRAACRMAEGAIQAATYIVFAMAELDRNKSGMGTTITSLIVLGEYAIFGQVGDSRIYRVRGDEVSQITEDHTLVGWQLKQGLITQEEADRSPHRNVITRAVGNRDYVQVDTGIVELSRGDCYLLCSDGLHGYLRMEEIPGLLRAPTEDTPLALMDLANSRGGRDNITAIVIEAY